MTYATDTLPAAGAVVAVDRISAVDFQRVKIAYGVENSATDVSSTSPMPIVDANIGALADTTATSDSGTFSLIALLKRLLAKFPAALGSAASAASLPVVIASDQAVISVSQAVATATGSITVINSVPAGTATAGSAVEITLLGNTSLGIQVTGTYTGALSLQITLDGTSWVTVGGVPLINVNTGGYLAAITSALVGAFQADVGGFLKARITGLAAMSGTATVSLRATSNPSMLALDAALPTGANTIGAVNVAAAQTLATVTTVSTVTSVASSTPAVITAANLSSAATTNATSVKTSSARVWQITATNIGAAVCFLKLYNKASAPSVGTDAPFETFSIPAKGVPLNLQFGAMGLLMATGLAYALTNLITDADATAVVLSQVKLSISYT